jgi:hypothetical protein
MLLGLLTATVGAAGCATDYEGTRETAADRARAFAHAAEDRLVDVASTDALTGSALLTAVAQAVPEDEAVIYGLEQVDDDTVTVRAAFDGSAQSGGGGSYYSFLARVCAQFVVTSGADPDVLTADTECDQADLDAVGKVAGANEVITFDD